jgi:hypothetical protein
MNLAFQSGLDLGFSRDKESRVQETLSLTFIDVRSHLLSTVMASRYQLARRTCESWRPRSPQHPSAVSAARLAKRYEYTPLGRCRRLGVCPLFYR